MTDEQREQYIRDCGAKMEAAMAAGNREEALGWLQAQNLAVMQRRPEYVAQLERARGLGPGCFFLDAGEADSIAILRRQAA
jgi:hypothetical protein